MQIPVKIHASLNRLFKDNTEPFLPSLYLSVITEKIMHACMHNDTNAAQLPNEVVFGESHHASMSERLGSMVLLSVYAPGFGWYSPSPPRFSERNRRSLL